MPKKYKRFTDEENSVDDVENAVDDIGDIKDIKDILDAAELGKSAEKNPDPIAFAGGKKPALPALESPQSPTTEVPLDDASDSVTRTKSLADGADNGVEDGPSKKNRYSDRKRRPGEPFSGPHDILYRHPKRYACFLLCGFCFSMTILMLGICLEPEPGSTSWFANKSMNRGWAKVNSVAKTVKPASVESVVTPASVGSDVTPASVGSDVTPESIGSDVTSASVRNNVTSASVGNNVTSASVGNEVKIATINVTGHSNNAPSINKNNNINN